MIGRGRRLLIVEDDVLTTGLLADSLRTQGFEVATAATVSDALRLATEFDPDVALLDINLGDGPSGIELGFVLDRRRPDIALVFLTRHPDLRTAGVDPRDLPERCGFLSKSRVPDSAALASAIDTVLAERSADMRHDRAPDRAFFDLNVKQMEILRFVAMGYTNDRIATAKGVTQSTVERWTQEIFRILGIPTRGDLNPRVEATRMFVAVAGLPAR